MKLISDIQSIDLYAWADFVEKHPEGRFFHSPEYYRAFCEEPFAKSYVFAVVSDTNEFLGISLVLIYKEASLLKRYFSRRAIAMAPPLCKDNSATVLRFLLDAQINFLKSKVIYYEIRNCQNNWFNNSLQQLNFHQFEHLNNVVDLKTNFSALSKKIIPTARGKARKALRKEVEVKVLPSTADLSSVCQLVTSLYRKLGLPYLPKSVYNKGFIQLIEDEKLVVLGAFLDKHLLSVMLTVCYKNEAYSWYMAGSTQSKQYSANDLLVIETLRYTQGMGLTDFNWGGAGVPGKSYGVRNFKEKFGGKTILEYRYIKLFQPNLYRLGKMVIGKGRRDKS